MASAARVLEVDLYGSAVVFEEFERVIARGGAGLIISSMAGHMMPSLPPEHNQALAFTPADDLLKLDCLSPEAIPDSMVAYIMAKRANALRVQACAVSWGDRGARVNAISPGIIATPLAQHEMASDIGDMYRAMIAASPAKRMAPPEEVAAAAAYLLGTGRLHHRLRPADRRRRHRGNAGGKAANAGLIGSPLAPAKGKTYMQFGCERN